MMYALRSLRPSRLAPPRKSTVAWVAARNAAAVRARSGALSARRAKAASIGPSVSSNQTLDGKGMAGTPGRQKGVKGRRHQANQRPALRGYCDTVAVDSHDALIRERGELRQLL